MKDIPVFRLSQITRNPYTRQISGNTLFRCFVQLPCILMMLNMYLTPIYNTSILILIYLYVASHISSRVEEEESSRHQVTSIFPKYNLHGFPSHYFFFHSQFH